MPKFQFTITASGTTDVIIEAPDAAAAHDIYESGKWRSDDPSWETFEVDQIVELDENGKPIESDQK
jgi:hypothetical protein